jgi:hypothetical protein
MAIFFFYFFVDDFQKMISVYLGQPLQPSDSEKETGNQGSQKSAKNKKRIGEKID